MRKTLAMMACAFLLVGSVAGAEMVENPVYQDWAKYKPGTSITHTQATAVAGMDMQMEMTQTLKEITPEKAVVEMSMKSSMIPGNPQAHAMDIPAKVEASQVQTPGKMPEGMKGEAKSLGKEKVKVGEKEYDCEVTAFKGESEGMKSEGKSWTSDQVPGSMVKMEMKAAGGEGNEENMETKMTLKSVEIK